MNKPKIRLLAIDDVSHWHHQLTEILHRIGNFEVIVFNNGYDFIDYYKNDQDECDMEEVIFIDCFMSEISGFDTLKGILDINKEAKCVMMTGLHLENMLDGIEYGAKWAILKPFDEANIRDALKRLGVI